MLRLLASAFALFLMTACSTPPDRNADWDAFRERFIERYLASHPTTAVRLGRHDFDGKLPDWSRAGILREVEALRADRDEAQSFDRSTLDEERAFEREYLIETINKEIFWADTSGQPFKNPFFYMRWDGDNLDPGPYVTKAYAPLKTRLEAYTTFAAAVPAAIEQIRANLETPMPASLIRIGRTSFGGVASFMSDDVPGVFESVADADLQQRFQEANSAAVDALRSLDEWLGQQEGSAGGDFALGAELFRAMLLETEALDISLDRLREIGEQDLERNRQALHAACERLAPGRSVEECLDLVQGDKPEGSVVDAARDQLGGLKQFILDQDLATIPGDEEALVDISPPHQRWNFAMIDIPGPYDKGLPATYYISPPDPAWPATQQHDYLPGKTDLLFTSVHEVWPGHFLHFMYSNRSKSMFGQMFQSYAFTEGWAHYAEEMMLEAGLGGGDPAVEIGQRLNALLRNARYLSAIGLHSGTMTVEQSKQLFLDVYQDEGTAEQQSARGTFDPAYLNYTLGKLMIRKLRDDWTAQRGGRQAWKEFHDRVLSYGGPPVPLLRRAMLGEDAGPAL